MESRTKHRVLAAFAHPDDETSVGPLLAKYASEGHDIYLASFTSGQKGVAYNKMTPGDHLGAIREGELRCSATHLGIHEPLLFGFQDQGISGPVMMEKVAERLRQAINRAKPDVMITFGAGGVTGHIDHIAAGEITTQVFQQQGLLEHKPRKLYYVVFPETRIRKLPEFLSRRRPFYTVSETFITTEVDCCNFLEAAYAAIRCHKTQWSPERMAQLHQMHANVLEGKVFLRLAISAVPYPPRRESSIFEGL
ncbi:MAG: PIG-L family deacetylase [Acidobacteria bacterium]|nr:PIG-L family deacetylase [Acidobacteriota bacterium]